MQPQRHLGFLITKASDMRTLVPLIMAAHQRNLPIFLLCGPSIQKSWSSQLANQAIKENLLYPGNQHDTIVPFVHWSELPTQLMHHTITDFITTNRADSLYEILLSIPQKNRPLTHLLQYAADYLLLAPSNLKQIDRFYVYSQAMLNFYTQAHGTTSQIRHDKFRVVGNIMLDPLTDLPSKQQLRAKHNLPDQPIVLMLTKTFGHPFSFFKRHFYTPTIYHHCLNRLARWTHQHNGHLAVKTRVKYQEPAFMHRLADSWHTDSTNWYPHNTLELIRAADLVVHFDSTAIFEIIAAGTPSLSFDVTSNQPSHLFTSQFYKSGIFSAPDIADRIKPIHLTKWLREHSLSNLPFDQDAQHTYLKHYLGFSNFKASQRIIEDLLTVPIRNTNPAQAFQPISQS